MAKNVLEPILCICRFPTDPRKDMLQCKKCMQFHHHDCCKVYKTDNDTNTAVETKPPFRNLSCSAWVKWTQTVCSVHTYIHKLEYITQILSSFNVHLSAPYYLCGQLIIIIMIAASLHTSHLAHFTPCTWKYKMPTVWISKELKQQLQSVHWLWLTILDISPLD